MKTLTTQQEELCSYTGGFGALLTLTCLVQHIIAMTSHWIAVAMIPLYLFTIAAYVFLVMQKEVSPILLIIASVFTLVALSLLILDHTFSLVVILLFIYNIVIIVLLYIGEFHKKFKEKARLIEEERKVWEGKI